MFKRFIYLKFMLFLTLSFVGQILPSNISSAQTESEQENTDNNKPKKIVFRKKKDKKTARNIVLGTVGVGTVAAILYAIYRGLSGSSVKSGQAGSPQQPAHVLQPSATLIPPPVVQTSTITAQNAIVVPAPTQPLAQPHAAEPEQQPANPTANFIVPLSQDIVQENVNKGINGFAHVVADELNPISMAISGRVLNPSLEWNFVDTQDAAIAANGIIKSQPYVEIKHIPNSSKVIIVGDILGDVDALNQLFINWKANDLLDQNHKVSSPNIFFVFLGNYVFSNPRYPHPSGGPFRNRNILLAIFSLKILNPENVFILRGNLDTVELMRTYAFNFGIYNDPEVIPSILDCLPRALYLVNDENLVIAAQSQPINWTQGYANKFDAIKLQPAGSGNLIQVTSENFGLHDVQAEFTGDWHLGGIFMGRLADHPGNGFQFSVNQHFVCAINTSKNASVPNHLNEALGFCYARLDTGDGQRQNWNLGINTVNGQQAL